MFFDNWADIVRILIVGGSAYAITLVFHRVSGKRTLSKLNAFDLVVTVALGSTLANILLSQSVSLAEGATALGLLIGLQFLVTWLSVRSKLFSRAIKSEPTLLVRDGEMLRQVMRRERVVPAEIRQAVRTAGLSDVANAAAVVLETDGTLSVLSASSGGEDSGSDESGDDSAAKETV
jgi:uncharacterized membrane protein YcaP (DUF421 family)